MCTQVTLCCSGTFGAVVEGVFRVSDVTLEVRGGVRCDGGSVMVVPQRLQQLKKTGDVKK